jgi:hypothetical protein
MIMETKDFLTLAELSAELEPKMQETKRLHEADGLYDARDIKVYVDMYRKSIEKHQGSEFASDRVDLEQISLGAGNFYGKTFEITRADKFDCYPTVWLKEVR